MKLILSLEIKRWPMREPFAISREVYTEAEGLVVTLIDEDGNRGRGEGCGITYAGETVASMHEQILAVRGAIEAGIDRDDLIRLLPHGGARFALDSALWDLQAKSTGVSAFARAGISRPKPVTTAFTIGIRSIEGYREAAQQRSDYPILKIKVDGENAIAAVSAAREGAPDAAFIVDPNQSWSVASLKALAPELRELGVVLLEQPIKVGDESGLDGYETPVQLCADELINDSTDLDKAEGRFSVINIKLDKAGGLTAALSLAELATKRGFELMVGCMPGSSLAMAPAMVLAQRCAFVDLDGPLLQSTDWPEALDYRNGVVDIPKPSLWG